MKLTLEISRCAADVNPREDQENLGTFWTWHRNYLSPDRDCPREPMRALPKGSIGLPVWLYDHSGCSYVAGESNPFSCPWDSGQVGWIFTTPERAAEWFGWKRPSRPEGAVFRRGIRVPTRPIMTKARKKRILDALRQEVEIYDAWQKGDVFGWVIYDEDEAMVEGCGGYLITGSKDANYMIAEAVKEMQTLFEGEF